MWAVRLGKIILPVRTQDETRGGRDFEEADKGVGPSSPEIWLSSDYSDVAPGGMASE